MRPSSGLALSVITRAPIFHRVIGLGIAIAALAVAWSHTFGEMWLRWFPAWNVSGLGLVDRFTRGASYYTHGPLVPLMSAVLAWVVYKQVGIPMDRTRRTAALGWLTLVTFLSAHLLSLYARVTFVSGFALIGVLGGLMLIWGGWALLRAYAWPIALMAFMVPLPMAWISDLNFDLKLHAINSALWLTTEVFHVPAVMDGSYVYLMPGPHSEPKTLIVDNVCGGLRSLISLVWFSCLLAPFYRVSGRWRLLLLGAAGPIAVGCNVIRITTLTLLVHYHGPEAAEPGSWTHESLGIMMFVTAIGLLLGLERLLTLLCRLPRRGSTTERPPGGRPLPVPARMVQPTPLSIGVLVLVTVPSVLWSDQAVAHNVSQVARNAVPATLAIDGVMFSGRDLALDQDTLLVLETNDYVFRRYTSPYGQGTVDLLIIFSSNNRKGTHPPEVCLEAAGEHIVDKQIHRLAVDGIGEVDLRGLVSQANTRLEYHLYVYKCGNRYTPSFLTQQATIFLNGLTARNAAGALIRFSVPAEHHDVDAARRLALSAASALLPKINEGLP